MTIPHIASPDVHVDKPGRNYYVLPWVGKIWRQQTRVATSTDGILFSSRINCWLALFQSLFIQGKSYAMSMPGFFMKGRGVLKNLKLFTDCLMTR
ncbi:MAG: hypothetical protein CM1200mP12_09230 [Gammaproteobacteria bacterium]|nr:MAG: hypothetical protein CM1200mP12_09230 [Gammaproteobacteria bacterium]